MPFKKKKQKNEDVATKVSKEQEETTEQDHKAREDADLFNMPEPQRDYIYNMRIINELIALRAAIEELTRTVKDNE